MKFKQLAITILSLALLAACGDGETGGANDGVVEISFLTRGNTQEIQAYQRAVDLFNEEHDDIQVEMETIPGDGFADTLLTRLQGGQAPDVFYVEEHLTSQFIANDTLLSLNEYLESDETYVDVDDFSEDIWGPAMLDDEIFGLPPDANAFVIYYNKDVFEAAGLDTPQDYLDRGEWTWDTFEYVTGEISNNGGYGFVMNGGIHSMNAWIFNNNGEIESDGEVVINSDPNTVEAIDFVNNLVQNGHAVYGATLPQGQGADAMFMSGQVGMVNVGRWVATQFEEAEVNFDIVPMPNQDGGEISNTIISTLYFAANKDTDYPEEAAKFLSYYVSEPGQEVRLSEGGNAVPSIEGMDELVLEDPVPDHAEYFLEGMQNGRTVHYEFLIPGLSDELNSIYEAMFVGEISTEEALEQAAEIATEMGLEHGVLEE